MRSINFVLAFSRYSKSLPIYTNIDLNSRILMKFKLIIFKLRTARPLGTVRGATIVG